MGIEDETKDYAADGVRRLSRAKSPGRPQASGPAFLYGRVEVLGMPARTYPLVESEYQTVRL